MSTKQKPLTILLIAAAMLVGCWHPVAPPSTPSPPLTVAERPYDEVSKWVQEIAAFEASDRINPPVPGSIVFVGSSSIVFWRTLERDMAPLPVLNRGFGGSKIYDAVFYADRIVFPYEPQAIVMFSGSNDIIDPDPTAPGRVKQGVIDFVADTRAVFPGIDIHYISITPTLARWAAHRQVLEANEKIAALAARDDRFYFIDAASALMKDGKPDPDFFVDDRLHLNASGYAVWTAIIRPHLMALYGPD